MGNVLNKSVPSSDNSSADVPQTAPQTASPNRKRTNGTTKTFLKRRRLANMSEYTFDLMYRKHEHWDVKIKMLGNEWMLHKVILIQSPYFAAMFNGLWKEYSQSLIEIEVLDDNITLEAVETFFSSMYLGKFKIDPKTAINLLATSSFFLFDNIKDASADTLMETINEKTVMHLYETAKIYGSTKLIRAVLIFLEVNLVSVSSKSYQLLKQVNNSLMTKLVASPDLYVTHTELAVYYMLRSWLYLHVNPTIDAASLKKSKWMLFGTDPEIKIQEFFAKRQKQPAFLLLPEGEPFQSAFKALRLQYLTAYDADMTAIINDNIIPMEWFETPALYNYYAALNVIRNFKSGPQGIPDDVFFKNCMRCGRILLDSTGNRWCWAGFNFGFDLVFFIECGMLFVGRDAQLDYIEGEWQFMIRATLTSFNDDSQPVFTQKTRVLSLALRKKEQIPLMVVCKKQKCPMVISINLLMISPAFEDLAKAMRDSQVMSGDTIPIGENGENPNLERPTTSANALRSSIPTVNSALFAPSRQLAAPLSPTAENFYFQL